MAVFGLTGSLCSGKTTVLKMLKSRGAKTFNSDKLVHRYYRDKKSPVYKKVKAQFPQCLNKNGVILRKRLRNIVFLHKSALKKLESIVHPYIIRDLKIWAKKGQKNKKIFIAEIPLIFERKLDRICTDVILVFTPECTLLKRIEQRFNISKDEALNRLKLGISIKEKKKLCSFVINNNSSTDTLKGKVNVLWRKLKKM